MHYEIILQYFSYITYQIQSLWYNLVTYHFSEFLY